MKPALLHIRDIEDPDNPLKNIQSAKWMIDCAIQGINESYVKGSPRHVEMHKLADNGYIDLINQLVTMEPRPCLHDVYAMNLNWLWENGEVPESVPLKFTT